MLDITLISDTIYYENCVLDYVTNKDDKVDLYITISPNNSRLSITDFLYETIKQIAITHCKIEKTRYTWNLFYIYNNELHNLKFKVDYYEEHSEIITTLFNMREQLRKSPLFLCAHFACNFGGDPDRSHVQTRSFMIVKNYKAIFNFEADHETDEKGKITTTSLVRGYIKETPIDEDTETTRLLYGDVYRTINGPTLQDQITEALLNDDIEKAMLLMSQKHKKPEEKKPPKKRCYHRYKIKEFTKEPTCTEDGEEITRCQNCGKITRTIPVSKYGHQWQLIRRKGLTHYFYKCERCGEEKEEKDTSTLETIVRAIIIVLWIAFIIAAYVVGGIFLANKAHAIGISLMLSGGVMIIGGAILILHFVI